MFFRRLYQTQTQMTLGGSFPEFQAISVGFGMNLIRFHPKSIRIEHFWAITHRQRNVLKLPEIARNRAISGLGEKVHFTSYYANP